MLEFAKTQPKGWNSWEVNEATVTEEDEKRNADIMAEKLKKYGWNYVVVDIQWYEPGAESAAYRKFADLKIDEYSRVLPAENRFPSSADGVGFAPLAEYVHQLGLKFGIHILRGIPRQAVHGRMHIKGTDKTADQIAINSICPWNSDMYGVDMSIPEGQLYYDSLMELYASWGVDFIKVDDIAYSTIYRDSHRKDIEGIRKAIDKTGRDIVLSLSPGPARLQDGSFLQKTANMWRLTDDFWDEWELLYDMFDRCNYWSPFIRKGNWPDCDMLPLGHIGICFGVFVYPYMKKKREAALVSIVYIGIMSVLYLIPQLIGNFSAYMLGVVAAFLVMYVQDRRNSYQKIFLAVTFFSIRWRAVAMADRLDDFITTALVFGNTIAGRQWMQ